jgi:hypothetical protein
VNVGRAAQRAHGVAEVLREGFQRGGSAHGALLLAVDRAAGGADAVEVAEAGHGLAARIVGGEAAREVVLDAQLEVGAQLVVQVGAEIGPPEAQVAPPPGLGGHGHAGCAVACSTLRTASAKSSQVASSSWSCWRPCGLRR